MYQENTSSHSSILGTIRGKRAGKDNGGTTESGRFSMAVVFNQMTA
jgi:hypothetical protein